MNLAARIPEHVRKRIPPIGSDLATPLRETMIYVRFYEKSTEWQWLILEMDGEGDCFGIVLSRVSPVAGRFTLTELEGLRGPDGQNDTVVLDLDFEPQTVERLAESKPVIRELLAVPSPREQRAANGLVDLE